MIKDPMKTRNKPKLILCFCIITLLCGCGSTPSRQKSHDINSAISEGSKYIASRIAVNSKIGVANIQSSSINITNYVIDGLLMHLVNEDKFLVIERSKLDAINKEQNYQLSGAVSDETIVSIGKQLGTQFIITGSMLPLGDKYSLMLKVTNVETAQIIGTIMYDVKPDNNLFPSLVSSKAEPKTETYQQAEPNVWILNNAIEADKFIKKYGFKIRAAVIKRNLLSILLFPFFNPVMNDSLHSSFPCKVIYDGDWYVQYSYSSELRLIIY